MPDALREPRIIHGMYTVIETPSFQKQAAKIWAENELAVFIDWLALNPLAGAVVPGTGGARKVRWTVQGKGKRGGARVIYFNRLDSGFIVLLAVYAKAEQENISTQAVKEARNEAGNY